MAVITILRGFKVHYAVLDAFLAANGKGEWYGFAPTRTAYDDMATLLRTKMGDTYVGKGARIVVPENGSGYTPTFVYVAYGWLHVFAHRELDLDNQIPKDCPVEFEKLRQEIMSFENAKKVRPWQRVEGSGRMGLHIVYTSSQHWYPDEILNGPVGGPVVCEECNKTCESPAARRKHLDRDHDIPIGPHELPEV